MASEMIQYVLKRGRAYRCLDCNYIENKSRMMLHFYNKHVLEYQIPFTCMPCVFKTGERKKLDRHLESPNHKEKVALDMESMSTLISQTPRYINEGEDIEKLSKVDSARHWIGVSQVTGEKAGESPSRVEDIRGQLLCTEPMVLTPPQSQEEGSSVARREFEERETQTEQVPEREDRIEKKLDELKSEVAEDLNNMFYYIDQLKTINNQQSELITRLNNKLDQAETREREAREKEREDRERRNERDRRTSEIGAEGHEKSRDRH